MFFLKNKKIFKRQTLFITNKYHLKKYFSSRSMCAVKFDLVINLEIQTKGGFFQKVQFVFQISKSPKKNIPKNYPELEI